LSAMDEVGLYVNTTVQLAPAPSVAPLHVPDLLNLAGAAGYTMSVAAPVPVLDTVIVCDPLVWPTVMLPNASEDGDAETLGDAGAMPVAVIATCTVAPPVKEAARLALSAPTPLGV